MYKPEPDPRCKKSRGFTRGRGRGRGRGRLLRQIKESKPRTGPKTAATHKNRGAHRKKPRECFFLWFSSAVPRFAVRGRGRGRGRGRWSNYRFYQFVNIWQFYTEIELDGCRICGKILNLYKAEKVQRNISTYPISTQWRLLLYMYCRSRNLCI